MRTPLTDYSTRELEYELERRKQEARPKPVMCVTCGYPHVCHGRNIYACGRFKHPLAANLGDTL